MKSLRCLFLIAPLAGVAHAQSYKLIDLGTLGGAASDAKALNAKGQVVGEATTAGGQSHAFLYDGGVMHDLGTFGGTTSIAMSINASGQVVGSASTADNHTHAFLDSGINLQDLGTLAGNYSEARGINDSGMIVGMSSSSVVNQFRAVSFSGGAVQNLGTLGGNFSYAQSINNKGDITGNSNTSSQFEDGFYRPVAGSMLDVGVLPGSYASNGLDVNNSGQVAGYSYFADNGAYSHSFVYDHGTLTDIGALGPGYSVAIGLNDGGAVVGYSDTNGAGRYRAYLYQNHKMIDVNTLITIGGAGWTVFRADDINANGWIVGTATNAAGASHAVLLQAVPEPASLFALATGLVFLSGRRRRA